MSMRCRYCGSNNSESALRCGKCQRRLYHGQPVAAPQTYPVVETATAPAYDLSPQSFERNPRARLQAVAGNPEAPPVEVRRRSQPGQPALFSYRQPGAVVEMDPWAGVAAQPTAPVRRKRSSRRSISENQRAFDFDAAVPVQNLPPVTHSSRPRLVVAPLGLRALATAFDVGVVFAFTIVFLLAIRLTMGAFPAVDLRSLIYFAPAPLLIMLAYKLVFAAGGRLTLGLQGAQLELIGVNGERPKLTARLKRVFAGCLSVASGAMGLLWAICDQETLTWHDHISNTFLTTGDTGGGY
jgi:uncharacterized RDD family membrane protein YckC